MLTPLVEQFRANPKRSTRLIELMQACRYRYRTVTVTVIGCGDAFINRYWPILRHYVNLGWVKLHLIDQEPIRQLIDKKIELARVSGEVKSASKLEELYQELYDMLKDQPSKIKYLDIKNPKDKADYWILTQDLVFVLVPDDIHIQCAQDWLGRATLVLIEKPYNRDLSEALTFQNILTNMLMVDNQDNPLTFVVCLDHYLAKIFEYVVMSREESLQRQIGIINRIEFSICEAGGVEPWRADSLDAGMIYDLLCHVLAQASPFVNLATFLDPRIGGGKVLVSQHQDCPIPRESFADANMGLRDFQNRSITLSGTLGKGVGKEDVKFLRLVGTTGSMVGDFGPNSDGQLFLDLNNGKRLPMFNIGKGHPEILDAIFKGRFIDEPVGGLTGEIAVEILKILTSIRTKIDRINAKLQQSQYPVGATPEEIRRIAIQL